MAPVDLSILSLTCDSGFSHSKEAYVKEYRTFWVEQEVSLNRSRGGIPDLVQPPHECADIDKVANTWAADGWRLVHLAPGTNGETYSGLFLTFERDRT